MRGRCSIISLFNQVNAALFAHRLSRYQRRIEIIYEHGGIQGLSMHSAIPSVFGVIAFKYLFTPAIVYFKRHCFDAVISYIENLIATVVIGRESSGDKQIAA